MCLEAPRFKSNVNKTTEKSLSKKRSLDIKECLFVFQVKIESLWSITIGVK